METFCSWRKTQSTERESRTSRGPGAPPHPTETRPWKGARGPRSWWRVAAGAGFAALLAVCHRRCLARTAGCCGRTCCASLLRLSLNCRGCCGFPGSRVLLPEGCGRRCYKSQRICGFRPVIDQNARERNDEGAEKHKQTVQRLQNTYDVGKLDLVRRRRWKVQLRRRTKQ